VVAQSHGDTMLSYATGLALIPMFASVIARQPFWLSLLPALTTFGAAAILLLPDEAPLRLVYYDSLFMIFLITVFTLILSYTLEHGARKEWLLSQLDRCQREQLEATTRRLQQLAVVDPLTGISNRRQLDDDLARIWQECGQDHRPVAMLILDVDHFKQYNDGYGHLQGDQCLRRVAHLIQLAARADKGLAARLGGEEFGILLPGAGTQQAARLAERVCRAVRDADIEHKHAPAGHVTVSIGVASLTPSEDTRRVMLFAQADQALYEAKRAGRDRVSMASPQWQPTQDESIA